MNAPGPRKIITPAEAAAELVHRREMKRSLYSFLQGSWHTFEGARPFRAGWHVGALCEHVESVMRGQIPNLLVNVPPRSTKSTVISVCLTPWAWTEFPETQFLCTSYDSNLSQRDHRTARQIIQSDWYSRRWPHVDILEDQNTKVRYVNTMGGFRLATAVDGANTGEGADVLVCDDPNSARDISDVALDSVLRWWHEVMPTRFNDFSKARRIVVQQRVHERDLSGDILANNTDAEWVHLRLPLEYEWSNPCVTVVLPSSRPHAWRDPRKKSGESLDPISFSDKTISRLKKELGSEYTISGQLQQRPAPGDGGIIRKSWFKQWPPKAEDGSYPTEALPKFEYIMVSIDTALNDTKTSAYNAATTWGVFKDSHQVGNALLLSMWRERCEYPAMRDVMIRMASDYLDDKIGDPLIKKTTWRKPHMMLVEDKGFGMLLARDLARAGVTVTRFNPHGKGDKTQRVRIISPLLEGGRIWLPLSAENNYRTLRPFAQKFLDQAASFPRAESRDLVDTMAQALYRLQASNWIWNPSDAGPSEPQDTSTRSVFY